MLGSYLGSKCKVIYTISVAYIGNNVIENCICYFVYAD